ncbi:MAG: DUF1080 domain-containing protein [Cyclobacteriaceae bacterium]
MKHLTYLLLGLTLFGCQTNKKTERPADPWVFRSVMDQKPRMVTAALSDEIWVAYDARYGSLYKAWKGGVNFDGAVYTTVHGPQPTTKGYAYFTDQEDNYEWSVTSNGTEVPFKFEYRGHRLSSANQVSLLFDLITEEQVISITETPEAIKRGNQNGLVRSFTISNAGEYEVFLNVQIGSLINERDFSTNSTFATTNTETIQYQDGEAIEVEGLLTLLADQATELKMFFHPGFDSMKPLEEEGKTEEVVLKGASLIAQSDCMACHNEKVKTVGPAYISIARKYNDSETSVSNLSKKIIKGGSGVWGVAMMTPHPDISEEDANEMARYILSLDDGDTKEDADAWHLGEKGIPLNLKSNLASFTDEQPGLLAHLYQWTGDLPNFQTFRENPPIKASIIPAIHVRNRSFLGDLNERIAIIFKGKIDIRKSGSYSFRIFSDDGSWLFIDGKEVINNGGYHGPTKKDGEVYLKKGKYPIEVHYFQGGGGADISLQWFNTDKGAFELVPESLLSVDPKDYEKPLMPIPKEELVKSIPGDQLLVAGVHPSFDLFQARPDDFKPRVGGIDFLSEDKMVVCTWDSLGPVYLVSNFRDPDSSKITVKRIASGLAEPLGIKVVDGEIYVLQKQELTKLIDIDGDGIIDEYQTVADDWRVSANFHEFAFGLVYKEGYFYGALATAIMPGGASANPQIPDRGKIVKISKETGEVELIASGLRTPNGIGIGVDNEIFVCDNQGDWLPASKMNHVKEGAWYGSRSVDFEGTEGKIQDEPVVWLAQDEIGNSPSTPLYINHGPYKDQMILCEVTHGGLKRIALEKINGNYQGAVFRFSQGIEAGVNRIAWAPDSSLVLGGIGVGGNWGQTGKLKYGLQRMVFNQNCVFEMLSVNAKSDGFEITFTEGIKAGQQISAEDFQIEQFYFKPTADYGGPKLGLETLEPTNFYLADDRKSVFIELDGLKEKHVVYIRIKRPFMSELDHELWTTEAWYTLTNIPENSPGFTNDYQVKHNTLTEEEKEEGWQLLFDGKTVGNFRNFKSESIGGKWIVTDGSLHFVGKGEGDGWQAADGGDIIITDKPYKDFEFQLDWKMSKNGNSGIIYNVVESDEYDYVWNTGPEYQLLDNEGHPDGQIFMHRAGDLYDLIPTKFVTVNPPTAWNRTRIVSKGGNVEHWLNGYKVVSYDLNSDEWKELIASSKFAQMKGFGMSKQGHIALQDHGDKVWFRNIKIREL